MAERNKKKEKNYKGQYLKAYPIFFIALSLLIILLPLETPVRSARVLLSYIFIPQIRAAHGVAEYLNGVNDTISSLLQVADENTVLKEEIAKNQLQNAQFSLLEAENARLSQALSLPKQRRFEGIWAKVAYREPSRRSTIIVDKGAADGVELRSPVIALEGGQVGLVGKIIEVNPQTAKILLSSDEDFAAAAFLEKSGAEGLATGDGSNGLQVKYIPLETKLIEGEKIYTSASSALFPDGILIGAVETSGLDNLPSSAAFLMPKVKAAVDPNKIKEVLILPSQKGNLGLGGN
ncbi:MAG: rod shape-determining protein MreC [Elusimicrobiota bacterium]|jgi:rod shape-determining protein MreC|nr:rod shape-determining protein MreC [Elusimicrobiota bacterium]